LQEVRKDGLFDTGDQPAHREQVASRHDPLEYVVAVVLEVDLHWIDIPE
jgi:hypothetical protein